MSTTAGRIELERAVDSIIIGRRHRTDLGDLDALAASIEREGLLQPPTVTPDGVLVCGRRRLAAIKQLGWRTVNVWVRSGISDRLGQLMSERDDNILHKPLTKQEASALYRELKQVMAEDAARRKAATQFSAENQPGGDGPANVAGPSTALGDARRQAAQMVTGRSSYTTLERIGFLQQIADDPTQPEPFRQHVTAELERIDAGAPVHPIYDSIVELAAAMIDPPHAHPDLDADAGRAVDHAADAATGQRRTRRTRPTGDDAAPMRYPVRAFIATWGELDRWWLHYDADELAAALSDEQIDVFLRTAEGTSTFAGQLQAARIGTTTVTMTGTATENTESTRNVTPFRARLHAL